MGHSCTLISHANNALAGVLKYAEDKFTPLVSPHLGGYYYRPWSTSPAQFADLIRSTVSDPEIKDPTKIKKSRAMLLAESGAMMDIIQERTRIATRHLPWDSYQEFNIEHNKQFKIFKQEQKKKKQDDLQELQELRDKRKIAIDCTSPENSMLLCVLENCNWPSFYAPTERPFDVDNLIRKHLNLESNDSEWAYGWVDSIGFILSLGKHELGGNDKQKAELANQVDAFDGREGKPLTKILKFLQDHYVSSSTFTHHH